MAGFIQQYWVLIVFGAAMMAMHLGHRGGHGGMGGCGGSHTGHTGHQGAGPAEHEESPSPPASDRRTQGAATPQDSPAQRSGARPPEPAHLHQ